MSEPVWVFDLEGTLTTGETWKGVARWLEKRGYGAAYRRFFNLHLPGALLAKAGLINKRNYQNRWMRDLARLFAGFSCGLVEEMSRWVVENELWPARREEVLAELQAGLAGGARVILASGTYEPVLLSFAERLGEGVAALGTPLVCRDGRASGELGGPVNVAGAKAERLRDYLQAAPERAYGDTYPDRFMLELAAEAVAVHPDRRLRELAAARGWRILE